jgi:hypothetical protein
VALIAHAIETVPDFRRSSAEIGCLFGPRSVALRARLLLRDHPHICGNSRPRFWIALCTCPPQRCRLMRDVLLCGHSAGSSATCCSASAVSSTSRVCVDSPAFVLLNALRAACVLRACCVLACCAPAACVLRAMRACVRCCPHLYFRACSHGFTSGSKLCLLAHLFLFVVVCMQSATCIWSRRTRR